MITEPVSATSARDLLFTASKYIARLQPKRQHFPLSSRLLLTISTEDWPMPLPITSKYSTARTECQLCSLLIIFSKVTLNDVFFCISSGNRRTCQRELMRPTILQRRTKRMRLPPHFWTTEKIAHERVLKFPKMGDASILEQLKVAGREVKLLQLSRGRACGTCKNWDN